jgi:hypothetical protein
VKGKSAAKIVFWCLMPFIFGGVVRFYFAILSLVFGTTFGVLFGGRHLNAIFVTTLVVSIAFSLATCLLLWKQYRKHILEG